MGMFIILFCGHSFTYVKSYRLYTFLANFCMPITSYKTLKTESYLERYEKEEIEETVIFRKFKI